MSHGPESAFTQWLKKYRYINISLIYLGTALVVIHFAEAVVHGLHMPDITFSLIVVLALAGLPIVLLIAWAFGHKKEDVITETSVARPSKRNWVKIITASVLSIVLFISAIFAYNKFFYHSKFTGKERSIAVLPFDNIGSEKENEYISDGITQDLINQLYKISSLQKVSGWAVVKEYKKTNKSFKEIAKELGVTSILTGTVQKHVEKIHFIAELIDVNTGNRIWGKDYDRPWGDVLVLQSEVAQEIANELNASLSKDEKNKIEKKPTNNPEAYDLFLKGRYAYNNSTLEGFHNAEDLFKEAIKKDPKFTLAYSYLANVYISLTVWMGDLPPSIGATKAMSVLNNSLQTDTLYIDFTSLAFIEFFANKNYPKAEYYFKRSIQLNPNYESTYIVYAGLLTNLGRTEESLAALNKAKILDPFNPFEFATRGENYYAAGKYDEAIKTYKESLQVFPNVAMVYDDLGRAYVAKEKYQDAINILKTGLTHATTRPPSTIAYLAIAYFKMNNIKRSYELIEELKQRSGRGEKGINIFIAIFYSAINNKEEAFNHLDQALNTNDVDLIWLKQEPSFKNIHNDLRYQQYLEKAGFN